VRGLRHNTNLSIRFKEWRMKKVKVNDKVVPVLNLAPLHEDTSLA
jgi:hypothetical protein